MESYGITKVFTIHPLKILNFKSNLTLILKKNCCDISLWTKAVDQWTEQHCHQTDIHPLFFFLTLPTPGVISFPPSYFQMLTSSIPPHPSQQ